MKFVYIVLHYKNLDDTIECIESIKKVNKDSSIIIVDNATLDDKEIIKIKKYTNDIIVNDNNLGFAKANNIGCKYAIKKYKPDFLVVINNDIVIEQEEFEIKVMDIYRKTNFDILGPKINTNGGESVNPFPAYTNLKQVQQAILKTKRLIKVYENFILRNLLKIYLMVKHIIRKPQLMKNGDLAVSNVSLHGCALIFSKKYYNLYPDIFYNETFLYHEEEFLIYRVRKDNLISYYDPDIEVFHKEGASLDKSFKVEYKKLIFRNKEILKSLLLLEDVMKNKKDI